MAWERFSNFFGSIPAIWWLPQKERLLLALAGAAFWGASIMQALSKDAAGTSIWALYGLGLLYIVCSLANVSSALRLALLAYGKSPNDDTQPRALLQLGSILTGMFILNAVVLAIYLLKGVTFTSFDIISIAAASVVFIILTLRYGFFEVYKHPFSRGYLAMAFKGIPQIMFGYIFLIDPEKASALTFWTLLSLTFMGLLRFWPCILAYRRDTKSLPLRGLLLGETGNMVSIALMFTAWSLALIR